MRADAGLKKARGHNKKIVLLNGRLFAHVRSHVFLLCCTCLKAKQQKCEFCPSGGQSLLSIHSMSLSVLPCVYACTQSGLGASLMVLRYICLLSTRPGINDTAKWSSHCSEAALIYHYSASIGRISTSLPMREAEGKMSRDKQPNSQIQSGERGRHVEGRKGGLEENKKKIKIQEGWERSSGGEMQIIYLENTDVLLLWK